MKRKTIKVMFGVSMAVLLPVVALSGCNRGNQAMKMPDVLPTMPPTATPLPPPPPRPSK